LVENSDDPCGVRPDISERVLAHVIPGIEGVIWWGYLPEKQDAPYPACRPRGPHHQPASDNVALLDEYRAKGTA
jgi:hypothetical protein